MTIDKHISRGTLVAVGLHALLIGTLVVILGFVIPEFSRDLLGSPPRPFMIVAQISHAIHDNLYWLLLVIVAAIWADTLVFRWLSARHGPAAAWIWALSVAVALGAAGIASFCALSYKDPFYDLMEGLRHLH